MKSPVLVVVLLLSTAAACAQTEGARISGRVTDPTDAVIVGAQCTRTDVETNVSTTTTTNQDGIYVLTDLHPATYRLTIQKDGFRTVVQPSDSYSLRIDYNIDMVLKAAHDAAVGAAGESGFEFSVIVTGFDECEWTNLTPVEAPPSPA